MTSTELVGPVRRYFIGNDHGHFDYDLGWTCAPYRIPVLAPRDTCTAEARACLNHHPACACFMAEVAENATEFRSEMQFIARELNRILAGHPTWDTSGRSSGCMCTGCQIARAIGGRHVATQEVEQNTARLHSWWEQVWRRHEQDTAGGPTPVDRIVDAEIVEVPF